MRVGSYLPRTINGSQSEKAGTYITSIVKAGAKIVGRDAGPVRPPLTDLKPGEMEALQVFIGKLGAQ
jgi:hypothetical protein